LRIPLEGNTFATLTAHLAEQAPFNLINSCSHSPEPCSPKLLPPPSFSSKMAGSCPSSSSRTWSHSPSRTQRTKRTQ
jgi:hypothetical protein